MQTFEIKASFSGGQWIKKTSSRSKGKYTRDWIIILEATFIKFPLNMNHQHMYSDLYPLKDQQNNRWLEDFPETDGEMAWKKT